MREITAATRPTMQEMDTVDLGYGRGTVVLGLRYIDYTRIKVKMGSVVFG